MSFATRIAQEFNNVRSHISGITAYHLLEGNLSVSNEVLTNGFSTTLYNGNGGTQSINTGIDMSTQWGNDASEKFGGLVWVKSRSAATNNFLFDTIRGNTKEINSNTTEAEATLANSLTAFSSTGMIVGSAAGINVSAATYVSWNFQTTHIKTGITNHGKAYTCHYNPFTGFTIVKYEGSGIAGHEIPHHLGRKLGFVTVKNLSAVVDWVCDISNATGTISNQVSLNITNAQATAPSIYSTYPNEVVVAVGTHVSVNTSTNQYIMYGWANSYYDEADKLIGNYEVGIYQGTGVAGNKVKTRGKPAGIMVKRLDVAQDWVIIDNIRVDKSLFPNSSVVEIAEDMVDFVVDGFICKSTTANHNTAGGQYLYMVIYDNDSGSGKSKYPRATDSSQLQLNTALVPFANGIDSNGSKNTIVYKNETITGLTYTAGKNYVYAKNDGTYGVKAHEPRMLASELTRRYAGESPDYYDGSKNKWFNTDAGSELVTNGKFDVNTSGWTAQDGAILSIDNGTLKVLNGTSNSGSAYQLISGLTVGKKYKIRAKDAGGNTTYSSVYINFSSPSLTNSIIIVTSGGTLSTFTCDTEFIAQATSVYIVLRNEIVTVNLYNNFDDISIFPIDIIPTTEITESRNYLDAIVHADANGQVAYVEELPKIEYKDIVKANEFKGKNACTAWVNFDGTTTPPTIRDSYNVSAVIRTTTGTYDVYFKEAMSNTNYVVSGVSGFGGGTYTYPYIESSVNKLNTKFQVATASYTTISSTSLVDLQIFGGKNQ